MDSQIIILIAEGLVAMIIGFLVSRYVMARTMKSKETAAESKAQSIIKEAELEAEVIKNLPTKSGMAVNELSEAERQRIRKVLQPVVDKYSKDYDPALLAEFWAEVEKARKATAK